MLHRDTNHLGLKRATSALVQRSLGSGMTQDERALGHSLTCASDITPSVFHGLVLCTNSEHGRCPSLILPKRMSTIKPDYSHSLIGTCDSTFESLHDSCTVTISQSHAQQHRPYPKISPFTPIPTALHNQAKAGQAVREAMALASKPITRGKVLPRDPRK